MLSSQVETPIPAAKTQLSYHSLTQLPDFFKKDAIYSMHASMQVSSLTEAITENFTLLVELRFSTYFLLALISQRFSDTEETLEAKRVVSIGGRYRPEPARIEFTDIKPETAHLEAMIRTYIDFDKLVAKYDNFLSVPGLLANYFQELQASVNLLENMLIKMYPPRERKAQNPVAAHRIYFNRFLLNKIGEDDSVLWNKLKKAADALKKPTCDELVKFFEKIIQDYAKITLQCASVRAEKIKVITLSLQGLISSVKAGQTLNSLERNYIASLSRGSVRYKVDSFAKLPSIFSLDAIVNMYDKPIAENPVVDILDLNLFGELKLAVFFIIKYLHPLYKSFGIAAHEKEYTDLCTLIDKFLKIDMDEVDNANNFNFNAPETSEKLFQIGIIKTYINIAELKAVATHESKQQFVLLLKLFSAYALITSSFESTEKQLRNSQQPPSEPLHLQYFKRFLYDKIYAEDFFLIAEYHLVIHEKILTLDKNELRRGFMIEYLRALQLTHVYIYQVINFYLQFTLQNTKATKLPDFFSQQLRMQFEAGQVDSEKFKPFPPPTIKSENSFEFARFVDAEKLNAKLEAVFLVPDTKKAFGTQVALHIIDMLNGLEYLVRILEKKGKPHSMVSQFRLANPLRVAHAIGTVAPTAAPKNTKTRTNSTSKIKDKALKTSVIESPPPASSVSSQPTPRPLKPEEDPVNIFNTKLKALKDEITETAASIATLKMQYQFIPATSEIDQNIAENIDRPFLLVQSNIVACQYPETAMLNTTSQTLTAIKTLISTTNTTISSVIAETKKATSDIEALDPLVKALQEKFTKLASEPLLAAEEHIKIKEKVTIVGAYIEANVQKPYTDAKDQLPVKSLAALKIVLTASKKISDHLNTAGRQIMTASTMIERVRPAWDKQQAALLAAEKVAEKALLDIQLTFGTATFAVLPAKPAIKSLKTFNKTPVVASSSSSASPPEPVPRTNGIVFFANNADTSSQHLLTHVKKYFAELTEIVQLGGPGQYFDVAHFAIVNNLLGCFNAMQKYLVFFKKNILLKIKIADNFQTLAPVFCSKKIAKKDIYQMVQQLPIATAKDFASIEGIYRRVETFFIAQMQAALAHKEGDSSVSKLIYKMDKIAQCIPELDKDKRQPYRSALLMIAAIFGVLTPINYNEKLMALREYCKASLKVSAENEITLIETETEATFLAAVTQQIVTMRVINREAKHYPTVAPDAEPPQPNALQAEVPIPPTDSAIPAFAQALYNSHSSQNSSSFFSSTAEKFFIPPHTRAAPHAPLSPQQMLAQQFANSLKRPGQT